MDKDRFVLLFVCFEIISTRDLNQATVGSDGEDKMVTQTKINFNRNTNLYIRWLLKLSNSYVETNKGTKTKDFIEADGIQSKNEKTAMEDPLFTVGDKIPEATKFGRRKREIGIRQERSLKETTVTLDVVNDCPLDIDQISRDEFKKRVLHDDATALMLTLNFSNIVSMEGSSGVILPFKWRWVFRDTLPYLRMPYPAVVWSLGLLALHNGHQVDVKLTFSEKAKKQCRNLQLMIGTSDADLLIGNALGDMTGLVAEVQNRYNTSHWCYMRKQPNLDTELFKKFDNNFFSQNPSLEYFCCKYNFDAGISGRGVVCGESHTYDPVWWEVPFGLGIFMLLYFPLIFLKASGYIHKKILENSRIKSSASDPGVQVTVQSETPATTDGPKKKRDDCVYNNGNSPITAASTIFAGLSYLLPGKQSTNSRLAIFVYSLLTLVIPSLELLLYCCYLRDYIEDLARNNITIGFSALVAGGKASEIRFSVFGGPFIALGIYLVIGWILMLTPEVMADQLYNGVCEGDVNTNAKSILNLSLQTKEELGSVSIRKHKNGYLRLLRTQVCQFYMLVNPDFWCLVAQIIKSRWLDFVSVLGKHISVKAVSYPIAALCLPFYILLCIIEIILAVPYFLIPLLSFICCIIRGFRIGLRRYVQGKCCITTPRLRLILRIPCCLTIVVLVFYYLYIFTVLFFVSFFFISRVVMFTYTAVVAYPRETYGYFMLIFISAYFGLEGFFHFGVIYQMILKTAIKACKHDPSFNKLLYSYRITDYHDEVYGISRALFEFLVKKIRPRRVQALHTFMKFVAIVFILSVSVVLVERFKKFEDLSLLIHVIITVFICTLPFVYKFVISKEKWALRIKRKVKKNLRLWLLNNPELNGIVVNTVEPQ